MAITEAFKKDVISRNIRGIRLMMKNSMLVDPSFSEFEEMSNYAKGVEGLYDAHDGKAFIDDKSQWTDSYMNKTMVELINNFSKERITHLKRVVAHLNPVESRGNVTVNSAKTNNSTGRNYSYQEQKKIDEQNGIIIPRAAKIATGAVVGGAVGGTVAGVAGGSVLGGIATGAIVIGAVVAIVTRGE